MKKTVLVCSDCHRPGRLRDSSRHRPRLPDRFVTLHAGTKEVLLDVVVRDKKGQRVTNLENSEIEIIDNGVVRKRLPVSG